MKKYVFSAAMFGLAVLVGFALLRYMKREDLKVCQVCSRPVHTGMGYRLELAGKSEIACCPRCGIHYDLSHPGAVRQAFARDFNTGNEILAQEAYYVEGGNEAYCAHVQPQERKQLQSIVELVFDRCTPPMLAFAAQDGANKYRAEHGGRLLNYAQARESVRER